MKTTPDLETVIRDLAARGELNHISLTPSQNGKLWRGSFAPSSVFGISYAEDADPVMALIRACSVKTKTRTHIKIDGRLKESVDSIPQSVVEQSDADREADALM